MAGKEKSRLPLTIWHKQLGRIVQGAIYKIVVPLIHIKVDFHGEAYGGEYN